MSHESKNQNPWPGLEAMPTAPVAELAFLDLEGDGPLPDFDASPADDLLIAGGLGHPGAELPQLDSHILMCACPDCKAPMTINLVLLAADCWLCQTSIELTEEQKREVRRQLAQQAAAQQAAVPNQSQQQEQRQHQQQRQQQQPGVAPKSPPPPEAKRSGTKPSTAAPSPPTPPPPTPRRQPAAAPQRPERRRAVQPRRRLIWDAPSWLVSLVFHLILMTLLALITFPGDEELPYITLSSEVAKEVREGGQINAPMDDDLNLDLPVPEDVDLDDPRDRKAMVKADQDARELRLDPNTPNLPDLNQVRAAVSQAGKANAALVARDPRLRVEMVQREGGTTLTEAAVARGLRWLSLHQMNDGRWSLHRYHQVDGCNCRASHNAVHSDTAGTGLALLPFLGAGQTHLVGRYRENVSRGLHFLLRQQGDDGDLRGEWQGNSGMYAHGICSIVLCEAFLLTGDQQLRDPAQRAIDFIVDAQNDQGGWRYQPRSRDGDTSVLGWQLMAMQSGRAAGLEVPDSAFNLAGQYLDLVEHRPDYVGWMRGWRRRLKDGPPVLMELLERDRWSIDDVSMAATLLEQARNDSPQLRGMWSDYQSLVASGGRYAYQPRRSPTHVMTAEALLCRMYLGWNRSMPGMTEGSQYLLDRFMPSRDAPNIYYWYYGTQVFHHMGGEMWDQWNRRMRDVLVLTQEKRGHEAGSWWDPRMQHANGGRLYVTALAICTLEVYYRHLPIYRQIDLTAAE